MNENQTNKDPKFTLPDQVNYLTEQVEALKSQKQNIGADNLQFRADTNDYTISFTVNAGAIKIFSIDVQPGPNILLPTPIVCSPSVFIDTDDNQNYLLRRGTSLSAGQLKSMFSTWEDWRAEILPMDTLTIKHFNFQVYNFDASSHIYYIHVKLFAFTGAFPLTVNIV